MQTDTRLQKFRSGLVPVIFVLLLLTLAALFIYLTSTLEKVQEEQNQIFLEEILHRTGNSIVLQLQGRIRYLQNVGTEISQQWPVADDRLQVLLKKNNTFFKSKRMGFIGADGFGVSSTGASISLRDRIFFTPVMSGQTVITDTMPDPEDTLPINILAVPVLAADKVVGVLFAVLNSEDVRPLLEVPLFQGQGGTYVITNEGQGVSLGFGRRMLQNNLFLGLADVPLVSPPLATIRAALIQDKTGTAIFRQRGTDYYLSYAPLGLNNWYVVAFVPTNFANAEVTATINVIMRVLAATTLLFFGLICYVILIQRRMRRDALQQAARMGTLVRNIPGGVVRSRDDAVWTLEEYSEGFLNLVGYSADEVKKLFGDQMFRIIHPLDRDMVQRVQDEGGGVHMEYRIKRKDGTLIWVAEHSQLVHEADGPHWFAVLLDISASHNAQERRRLDEERYRILFDMSEAILYEYDMRSGVLHTTWRFFEKFNYPAPESLAARHAVGLDIIHPDDRDTFMALHATLMEGQVSAEALIRVRRHDGQWLWCHMQQTALLDAARHCIKALGKITNVDAETRALHQLREEVQRDPFTGLFNKIATAAMVDQTLDEVEAEVQDAICALCVIDVDNFKSVNDCMGHGMGDTVLKELSAALAQLFRSSDVVGRVGGDEFVVFMRDVKHAQMVEVKMGQVQDAFRQTFDYTEGEQVRISASIGVTMSPRDGNSFSMLFPKADKALYRSKKTKDQISFYDAELDKR